MKTFASFLIEQDEFDYSKKSLFGDDGEKISTHGGYIDVRHKNSRYSPRQHSIVDFVVDADKRGNGIGKKLVRHALQRHNDLGGQASSIASVKVLHGAGFRNPDHPKGSVEDHLKMLHDDSSVYMAHKDENGTPYV